MSKFHSRDEQMIANEAIGNIVMDMESLSLDEINDIQKEKDRLLIMIFNFNDCWVSPSKSYVKFNYLALCDRFGLLERLEDFFKDNGFEDCMVYMISIRRGLFYVYLSFNQNEWDEKRKIMNARLEWKKNKLPIFEKMKRYFLSLIMYSYLMVVDNIKWLR
jgi:hypothetical protein